MANGIQSFLGAPTPFEIPSIQDSTGLIPVDQTFEQTFENEFMEQLLNPQNEAASLISAQARATMNREDATEEEKEITWGDAIGAMSLYNTFDAPTQQDILNAYKRQLNDEFGIDIEDFRDINRSGDPYIAAGDTLIEANRAGYSPAQAIGKALSAYNAEKKASQLPDANYVNLALGLLDKSATQAAAYAKAGKGSGVSKDYKITGMLDGVERTDIVPLTQEELARTKLFVPKGTEIFEATADDKGTKNYAFLTPGGKVKHTAMRPYQYDQWVKNNPDRQIREIDDKWYDTRYAVDGEGNVFSGDMDYMLSKEGSITPLKNTTVTTMFDKKRGKEVKVPNEAVLEDMKKPPGQRRYSAPSGSGFSISIGEDGTEISQGNLSTSGTLPLTQINRQNARIEKAVTPIVKMANDKALVQSELSDIITNMEPLMSNQGGGFASRGIATLTGITDSFSEVVDILGYGDSPNTVFLDAESGENINYNEMYERFKQENASIQNSTFYRRLSNQGADQDRLDRMIFHLAIAGASAKGFTGRALSDRDLALWMTGFGGDAMTGERFRAVLFDTHDMILNQYDDYLEALPLSAGNMLINVQKYGTSESGESIPTIGQETINPLEKMKYIRRTDEGFEIDPTQINIYDTARDRERIKAYQGNMAPTVGVDKQVITVDRNPDTISAWIKSQDDSKTASEMGQTFGEIMLPFRQKLAEEINIILSDQSADQDQDELRRIIAGITKRNLEEMKTQYFPNDNSRFQSFLMYNRAYDNRKRK
tara:strand:+ start:1973 stop:4270 length:2298 start_codon:yes stop_codon:yes gene_type:complete